MKDSSQQPGKKSPAKKKKGQLPFRRFTTVLGIMAVLLLTLVVYEKFGVGDAWFWIHDVLVLILLMFLIFLAAVFVVWLLMLFREHRDKV